MNYLATLPGIPKYLEEYIVGVGGWMDIDKKVICIDPFASACTFLKRNLVPFKSEEDARKRWPKMFEGPRIGMHRLVNKTGATEFTYYLLGPCGADEVASYIRACFCTTLLNEWVENVRESLRQKEMPDKKKFYLSFCERHGITCDETNYISLSQIFNRIISKVGTIVPVE